MRNSRANVYIIFGGIMLFLGMADWALEQRDTQKEFEEKVAALQKEIKETSSAPDAGASGEPSFNVSTWPSGNKLSTHPPAWFNGGDGSALDETYLDLLDEHVKPPNCPEISTVEQESCPCFFERLSTPEGRRMYMGHEDHYPCTQPFISRCCRLRESKPQ